MNNNIKELRNILYNHGKLISMISNSNLPIKQILLEDVKKIHSLIEGSSIKNEKSN